MYVMIFLFSRLSRKRWQTHTITHNMYIIIFIWNLMCAHLLFPFRQQSPQSLTTHSAIICPPTALLDCLRTSLESDLSCWIIYHFTPTFPLPPPTCFYYIYSLLVFVAFGSRCLLVSHPFHSSLLFSFYPILRPLPRLPFLHVVCRGTCERSEVTNKASEASSRQMDASVAGPRTIRANPANERCERSETANAGHAARLQKTRELKI